MNDNPHSHEFDWVTARERCSLEQEFGRLKKLVKHNWEDKKAHLKSHHMVTFAFVELGEREFVVCREPRADAVGKTYKVIFSLRVDHIHIENQWDEENPEVELTLVLNDNGECRFVIDGSGEYLRWQVTRRALSPDYSRHGVKEVVSVD